MTLTSEERMRLFTRRNDILKNFNELLKNRKYIEASLILEEGIKISKELGEIDLANEYSKKIVECATKIKAIDDEIRRVKADPDLFTQCMKEKGDLITFAQEAAQNQQYLEACNLYKKAVDICIKMGDKKTVWKLTKNISLLERKILPMTGQEAPSLHLSPIPKQPVKKEIPFFKPVLEEKEENAVAKQKEVKKEKKKPMMSEKKLKKKFKLAEKIAQKKLEEAEKKFLKKTKKEEEEERKEAEKKEKKKEKKKKSKDKEIVKKIKKEKVPIVGKSGLTPDVLAEIKSFKQNDLESVLPEKKEKKKSILGRSLLPADVLEELKKKTDKSSE